jgi:predicted RNA-binding Zn ribbon-like protein
MFLADALGLDLLNTVAAPAGHRIEWIADGDDLLAWLEKSHQVPTDAEREIRRRSSPASRDAVAGKARSLREWFRSFVQAHKGERLEPRALDELGPLNAILAKDQAFGRIEMAADTEEHTTASGLSWRWDRRWPDPEAMLQPLAQAMAELVCDADFSLVKQCEGPGCTMVFLDKTKGHARRWCSMALCGNRAKQAAHRARKMTRG